MTPEKMIHLRMAARSILVLQDTFSFSSSTQIEMHNENGPSQTCEEPKEVAGSQPYPPHKELIPVYTALDES